MADAKTQIQDALKTANKIIAKNVNMFNYVCCRKSKTKKKS